MAMKVFSVGEVLAAADVNAYCVNTGFAIKPSSTSRASAPGFADDPDLQLPILANASYRLLLMVQFNSPSAAGFSFTFTGSGSNHLYGRWTNWNPAGSPQYVQPNGSLGTGAYDGGASADLTSTSALSGSSGTGTNWLQLDGILTTSTSSGTLTFRWSQTSSNSTATVVLAGSSLCLWRVA